MVAQNIMHNLFALVHGHSRDNVQSLITSYRSPLNLLPPPAILKKASHLERVVMRVIDSFSFSDLALS